MHAGIYPEVPDDFGHWLAGFIDGEGSFYIQRYRHAQGYGYQPRFALKLREDDRPALDQCAELTGIGYVRMYARAPQAGREGTRPQAEWLVITKAHCARLVEVLDRFPLRSKKARDYAVWREAVLIHAELRPTSSVQGKGRNPHEWGRIPELWRELPRVRAYEHAAEQHRRRDRPELAGGLRLDRGGQSTDQAGRVAAIPAPHAAV